MSQDTNCLFCKIVTGEIPGDVVYEDDEIVAFNDIQPQAPVHILIIPKSHVASLNAIEDDAQVISRLAARAKLLAVEYGIAESGYRILMNCNAQGGQTVYHIHMHLLGGRQLGALG